MRFIIISYDTRVINLKRGKMSTSREVDVKAFCGYCTSAVLIFLVYIPGVVVVCLYSKETTEAADIVVAAGLTATFVIVHSMLPFVCGYTELPDSRSKIVGFLAIQLVLLIWHLIGFIYIIVTLKENNYKNQQSKNLGIATVVIISITMLSVLTIPLIVFGIGRLCNVVCYGPCMTLHKTWRLRKAISEYTPLNFQETKST